MLLRDEGTLTAAETLPVASIAGLALGLGLPLVVQGVAAWRQQPSSRFRPSWAGWLALSWALVLGLGWAVSGLPILGPFLLPLFHVLAMVLPPLVLLGLVGQILYRTGVTWRGVIAGLAGGGLGGLGLALVGEILALLALVLVGALVTALTPGGVAHLREWSQRLQELALQADPTDVLDVVSSSPLIIAGTLVLVVVVVPVVEETAKTLVVGVAGRWFRPTQAQALLWGVASGAGFAAAENLFNGAVGGADAWVFGALARVGATIMHCFTAALVAWGWSQLWTVRRPGRLVACYLTAITLHGIWNTAAAGSVFAGISVVGQGSSAAVSGLAEAAILVLLTLLVLLAVTLLVALLLAARYLAPRPAAEQGRASPTISA
jgi:RsiW-degrading membrane proteinase PrsW (M82 family)